MAVRDIGIQVLPIMAIQHIGIQVLLTITNGKEEAQEVPLLGL